MAAMSPFEIFGLKPQFRIDKQKLDEKYFETNVIASSGFIFPVITVAIFAG